MFEITSQRHILFAKHHQLTTSMVFLRKETDHTKTSLNNTNLTTLLLSHDFFFFFLNISVFKFDARCSTVSKLDLYATNWTLPVKILPYCPPDTMQTVRRMQYCNGVILLVNVNYTRIAHVLLVRIAMTVHHSRIAYFHVSIYAHDFHFSANIHVGVHNM